ncbi:MAG: ParA family protein [Rickettsiales bacterium]|nr:ParA family protein [Rickettsiales bacterium]
MKILSVVNQKGGVGKTTTALNVSAALAVLDYKVLVVDFDPQGNLSSGFGIGLSDRQDKTVYNVLLDESGSINDIIFKTKINNLDVLTADTNLSAFEIEVFNKDNREFILSNLLDRISNKYDYVIIDCPPSLGFLTINSLACSNYVLIPLQCEFFALEGLSHLLETLERVKVNLNPKLTINGVLLTMYDRRNKLTEQVENDVRGCLGDLVYKTVIPRNVKLTESTSFGIPTIIYDQNCSGSIAYINFVKEMVKRL